MVTGLKRSGKDTLGNYLVKNYGYIKAQPIACFKAAIQDWFDFSDDQMNNTRAKEKIDPRWGISPRKLMQLFGTDLMKTCLGNLAPEYALVTGNNLWAKIFKEWYLKQPDGKYVVCDWRFPEEREIFGNLEGITTVRVINNRVVSSDTHISEQHIMKMSVNFEITNNGTLEEFYKNIDKVVW
jgi:hypothetical protein